MLEEAYVTVGRWRRRLSSRSVLEEAVRNKRARCMMVFRIPLISAVTFTFFLLSKAQSAPFASVEKKAMTEKENACMNPENLPDVTRDTMAVICVAYALYQVSTRGHGFPYRC